MAKTPVHVDSWCCVKYSSRSVNLCSPLLETYTPKLYLYHPRVSAPQYCPDAPGRSLEALGDAGARAVRYGKPSIANKAAVWLDLGLGGCLSWAAALPGVLGAVGSHGSPPSSGPPPPVPVPARTPEPWAQRRPLVFARQLAGQRESTPSSLPTLQPPPGPWFRVLALRPQPVSHWPSCPWGLGCFCEDSGKELGRKSRAQPDQTTAQHAAGLPWAWPLLPGGS